MSIENETIEMVCGTCGSTDVFADAYAAWNTELQMWELDATFDKGAFCNACEGECRIKERPIEAQSEPAGVAA